MNEKIKELGFELVDQSQCEINVAINALDKQIPFTPETNNLKVGLGRCKCGAEFLDKLTNYCGNCGQRILWEVEE